MVLQTSVESERRGTTRWFRLGRNRPRGNVTTEMSGLVQISDTARLDSIRSLVALSQRLSPIPRSVPAPLPSFTANTTIDLLPNRSITYRRRPSSFFCEGARLLQENRPLREGDVSKSVSWKGSSGWWLRCNYCDGLLWARTYSLEQIKQHEITLRFFNKSHTPCTDFERFVFLGCIFCDSMEVFTSGAALIKHLEEFHADGDFRNEHDIVCHRI